MPKGKSKTTSRRRQDSDESVSEDEEAVPPTQINGTQPSSSAAVSRAFSQLSVQDRDQAVNNIVRYLLIADQRKMPIKRQDIIKNAIKDNSRAFTSLMPLAAEKLRTVFGIELVEIESGASKQKVYILVTALDNDCNNPHQTWPERDNAKIGLIMVILSVIFMRGNILAEDELYDMLHRLGIRIDHPDENFGDVKRLLTHELVRMGYLDIERGQGEPSTVSFRWGPRAKAETSKRNALDFIGQVFGDESQERWIAQVQDMQQSEGTDESNQAGAGPSTANGEKTR